MKIKINIGYLVLSVALSFLLWLTVMSWLNPDGSQLVRNIPVKYVGASAVEDRGLELISASVSAVSATFYGRRSELSVLSADTVVAEIDLSTITGAGSLQRGVTFVVPQSVRGKVTNSQSSPSYVTLQIDKTTTKTVPVKLVNDSSAKEGYKLGIPSVEPAEIRVTGPASALDGIASAEVAVAEKNLETTLETSRTPVLKDASGQPATFDGFTLDVSEVRVVVPVRKTKTLKLDVRFIDGGGLTAADNVSYTVEPSAITVSGDPNVLDGLNTLFLDGEPDLAGIIETSGSITLDIPLPNGCESESGETNALVRYEITGADSRNVLVNDVQLIGATPPEGYTVRIVTNALTATIRGPNEVVWNVGSSNVRAVADLSGSDRTLTEGQATAPAVIYVDGYSSVAAIGNYQITYEVVPIRADNPPET